jgi:hypothetical protein
MYGFAIVPDPATTPLAAVKSLFELMVIELCFVSTPGFERSAETIEAGTNEDIIVEKRIRI